LSDTDLFWGPEKKGQSQTRELGEIHPPCFGKIQPEEVVMGRRRVRLGSAEKSGQCGVGL
jgi:hypothetical protein